MNKIRVQNVKTGKISEITQTAWNILKNGGNAKIYEVLNKPTQTVKFNVPTPELKTTTIESPVIESPVAEVEVTEPVTIPTPVVKSGKPKSGRKPKK